MIKFQDQMRSDAERRGFERARAEQRQDRLWFALGVACVIIAFSGTLILINYLVRLVNG